MKHAVPFTCVALLLAAGAAGCSNPADNVPAAAVAEATAETAAPEAAPEPAAEATLYALTGDSTVGFIGSKVTGSHEGGFNSFSGEIALVNNDPAQSSVSLSIDTHSMWSDSDRLTGHLKSADFFDVETYPTAEFSSTAIVAADDGFMVTGNLNLHGVTRSITFPARIEVGADQVTATAEFSIMRFDFDIVYPGKPDDLIRDEVVVKLNVVAAPAAGGDA